MKDSVRGLAWCGVAAPVLRLGLILVVGALHPTYSQARDFISELGAPDSPYAALMNYVGIGFVGLLLALFSVALYRGQARGALALAGAALLAASGVAFVAVGLLPCDRPGCSPDAPSAAMRSHLVAGVVAMCAQTLATLAFGLRLFTNTGARWYAAASFGLGSIALAALGLLLGTGLRLRFPGLAQKTMQVATDLWVLVSAIDVLHRTSRQNMASEPSGRT